jgi:hypothetical protein
VLQNQIINKSCHSSGDGLTASHQSGLLLSYSSLCGISDGQSGTWTGFIPSILVSQLITIAPTLHTDISVT